MDKRGAHDDGHRVEDPGQEQQKQRQLEVARTAQRQWWPGRSPPRPTAACARPRAAAGSRSAPRPSAPSPRPGRPAGSLAPGPRPSECLSAKMGSSATAPPNSTANKSSDSAASTSWLPKMNLTPAQHALLQAELVALNAAAAARPAMLMNSSSASASARCPPRRPRDAQLAKQQPPDGRPQHGGGLPGGRVPGNGVGQ